MTIIRVNEIYLSIQGESTWAGLPCVLVRLAGCPLRCRWCDTTHARDPQAGRGMTLEQVLEQVAALQCHLVEVTGGEPLAQAACPELLARLCQQGYTVLLETSGALDISAVDPRVHLVMDIKCPGSGMSERMLWSNLERLGPGDEVKFVLADHQDYLYARQVIRRHGLERRCRVLLSAVAERLDPRQVVEWMLADRLPARFQLQMHKYIWPPQTRGV